MRGRVAAVALSMLAACAMAQYTIDWHTITGGGGTATGGVYSVKGTIGQPDTGATMNGGSYSLRGGYWTMVAVQTEGAPYLSIAVFGTDATLSWEGSGWILQQTSDLNATWTNSPSGATNPTTVPASSTTMFYRLSQPY